MKPNIENLQRMVECLRTVDAEAFEMKEFIKTINTAKLEDMIDCKTSACAIGHCICLDPQLFRLLYAKNSVLSNGLINEVQSYVNRNTYVQWSEQFTGIKSGSNDWEWCFGSGWNKWYGTLQECISRIEAYIKGDDWVCHYRYQYFRNVILNGT